MQNVHGGDMSFKARIVTTLKGRDNFVKQLSQAFEEESKGYKGSLLIDRGKGEYKGSLVCTLGRVKDSPEFYIGDYQKYLSQESQNVTPGMINQLAARLFKVMQILRKEHSYYKNNDKLNKLLEHVKNSLNVNRQRLEELKSSNKNSSFTNVYSNIIKSNIGRIVALKKEQQELKDKFIQDSQKIAGKNDPILNEYVEILKDIL